MKQHELKYYKKEYSGLYALFMERSLIMIFLNDLIKDDISTRIGFEVDAWRYVFKKDISKSQIIKNLTRSGINNLVALEVIDKLNNARKIVDEVSKEKLSK